MADVQDPEKPDYFWLNFMVGLGLALADVRDDKDFDRTLICDGALFAGYLNLPSGNRYYCSVWAPRGVHAFAVEELGMVFDPSTSAPMIGAFTLGEYLNSS